ncbi:putative fatty-acid--CoA ligase FadD10 [Gonapodya sp. JEL0774]|nr:putative fatty-acid--CoA ligase FadD10 [Gonapodya sp. JEL0774]
MRIGQSFAVIRLPPPQPSFPRILSTSHPITLHVQISEEQIHPTTDMSYPPTARQWIVKSYPDGDLVPEKVFEARTAKIPPLKDGEVLVKQLYLSLDPAMRAVGLNPNARGYAPPNPIGSIMAGGSIGQIVASRNPAFPVGERLNTGMGWQEYFVIVPKEGMRSVKGAASVDLMSVLGGTGMTAYFGVFDILKPKPGQLAIVSGAAGATGLIATQLLKIAGCTVIAIAGTKEKCAALKSKYGADYAWNYKEGREAIKQKLRDLGRFVDLYFDNVGGYVWACVCTVVEAPAVLTDFERRWILAEILERIALNGRIALCGQISLYNSKDPAYPLNTMLLVTQRAIMQGFLVLDYVTKFPEARAKMANWIADGKLKGEQTIVEGFENIPRHFLKLFDGSNTGKLLVKVGEEIQQGSKFFLLGGLDSASSPSAAAKLPSDLDPNYERLFRWIRSRTLNFKFHPAIVDATSGKTYTYLELRTRTEELARAMNDPKAPLKLVAGDRVILFIELPVVLLAAARIGVAVSTAHFSFTVDELTSQLKVCDAKAIFTHTSLLRVALDAARNVGIPRTSIFVLDGEAPLSSQPQGPAGLTSVNELVERGKELPFTQLTNFALLDLKRTPLYIPFSSGTTGRPKGVVLSHSNIVSNVVQLLAAWQRQPRSAKQTNTNIRTLREEYDFFFHENGGKDAFLVFLPLSHAYALSILNLALAVGGKVVIMQRYTLDSMLRVIQELPVVPSILLTMSQSPLTDPNSRSYDLNSLRVIHTAAAPSSLSVAKEVERRMNSVIVDAYGMTEMSPGITLTTYTNPTKDATGYSGVLNPSTEARVVSPGDSAKDVGIGEEGEILVRGPQLMQQYLADDTEAAREVITSDGWLRTGDLGRINAEGLVTITERLKELIKYKGISVPPAELESLILLHPGVADCCVVGVPDESAGELPKAYVVPRDPKGRSDQQLSEDVASFVAARVAPFKHLRGGVEVVASIPKSRTGKLERKLLRDQEREKYKLRLSETKVGKKTTPTKKRGGLKLKL